MIIPNMRLRIGRSPDNRSSSSDDEPGVQLTGLSLSLRLRSGVRLTAIATQVVFRAMGLPAAKLSISLPGALAAEVRRRVGSRGVSGFVARAVAHELEREQLGAFLGEMERKLGPIPKSALAAAKRAWPKR